MRLSITYRKTKDGYEKIVYVTGTSIVVSREPCTKDHYLDWLTCSYHRMFAN